MQFLTEAVILSLTGGAIGILLGYLLATGLTEFFAWPSQVAPGVVAGAFGFAAMVGTFFGWYPAQKAANTEPIEALRAA
jgi:ABC-type antimicrobial peptide transport system permease subunit